MGELVIGVDLGGTVVRAGAVDQDANLLAVNQSPIEAHLGSKAGLARIIAVIEKTFHECPDRHLLGIGFGATGPVNRQLGVIQNPYTLPGWANVPIVAPLSEHFSVPVKLENDADVAALGEYWAGAGKGTSRLYAITLGTGIGTALISDGLIYRGLDGSHPEGGHQIIDPAGPACYCGANGCWESLAAGPAIARLAREIRHGFPSSRVLELAHGDPGQIDAQMVAQAAQEGDALGRAVMEKAAWYFSLGLINIINLFVPEVIVLSGGVMKSANQFLSAIETAINTHDIMVPARQVSILPAKLGDQAGMVGAAYTIFQNG